MPEIASPRRPRGRPRQDHEPQARERLLDAAARLFADQGFAETSTREICTAAGLNAGAIHYHFGDKDALYRAVLARPLEALHAGLLGAAGQGGELRGVLQAFLGSFLQEQGTETELRLHLRELLNPSPVYARTVVELIGPAQRALSQLLAQHMGRQPSDETVLQLGYGLVAMAQDYCLSRAFIAVLTPGYLEAPDVKERILQRLLDWAEVLVEHERRRALAHAAPFNPSETA
ncbi:TetR/AcrR family transcriptional regulator [Inhella gelatinilytica]|uniref:CerR family C-terminal domain-containing protein n=1 Tax=Inhella gelatinilytica TaxID=2795030 RepID=A0A931NB54_9BURK|nr:TetR/AcrR family transcriptional regulator [Inhella gelatinilytica]MBH9553203.1 CerR family C-terminal domain-containing protein [Inhella gelatinilytica]